MRENPYIGIQEYPGKFAAKAKMVGEFVAAAGQAPAVPVPAGQGRLRVGELAAEWYEGSGGTTGCLPGFALKR